MKKKIWMLLMILAAMVNTALAEKPGEELKIRVNAQSEDAVVMSVRNEYDRDTFAFVSGKTEFGYWGKNGASLIRLDGKPLDGRIGILTFQVDEEAVPGDYTFSFKVKNAYNIMEEKAKVKIKDVKATVEDDLEKDPEAAAAFVSRCYRALLNREADPEGLNAWAEQLLDRRMTAAKTVQAMVASEEYASRQLNTEEKVESLYQAMLGRAADPEGGAWWADYLEAGCSESLVIKGFSGSAEFISQCSELSLRPGKKISLEDRDENKELTAFVSRCYREALGREAEVAGLNSWCREVLDGNKTAKQVASGFVFSEEVRNKGLNDEETVDMLYRLYLGREADPAGKAYWLEQLAGGMTPEQLNNGFADSEEFLEILRSYGLYD